MEPPEDIERVSLLSEPVRRRLYLIVREAGRGVSREDAAAASGVSRSLAAFHLDRLAEAGLLDVEYRRVSGRRGRGAGRPAKLYRPGRVRVEISLPPTRYALAGDLLIQAVMARRPGQEAVQAVRASAEASGRRAAEELRRGLRRRSGLGRMRDVLVRLGFEPEEEGDRILLRNCPFHELARRHPDLVCGMNEAFLGGVAQGVAAGRVVAEPFDAEGYCCAMIRKAP